MHIPAYKLAANELSSNHEQWTAYESKGHFVVLAGPGSGKTKVLTTKLARILHEDVEEPRGVACVTYSNECARELKRRLAKLGIRPSRRAFVGTVHSFCFQNVVVPFAQLSGLDIAQPIRVATDAEQKECFANALLKAVSMDENPSRWTIRCSNYRRKHLERAGPEWSARDNQAARVIEQYEKNLRSRGLIDFDDMMLLGLRLIEENEWVRRALYAKFPVLIVDEYQDLGVPLHRLVLSLCFPEDGRPTRLFAVGDPDQSIYGFNGAEPDLLRTLSNRPEVESTTLRLNYRSRQYIISASEIALGEERGYESVNEDAGTIDFHYCKNGLAHQASYAVNTLVPKMRETGAASSLGEIAVLYRTKSEGDIVAEHVSASGFEFIRIDGNSAYLRTPLTRWLEECAAWCDSDGGIDAPSLRAIIGDFLGFNRTLKTEMARQDASNSLVAALRKNMDGTMPLNQWLSSLTNLCLRSQLSSDPTMQQELAILEKLITSSGEGEKLSDWSVSRFGGQGGSPDHLNLMTLHSSKGLEFDVVILFGMDQGIIPSYREKSLESKREPKRLFYVGLTRARHEVHVTYSGWRTTPWGARYNDGPSEFIVELSDRLRESSGD